MDLQICSNTQSYISSTLVKKRGSLRAADLLCSCSHMHPFRTNTELAFAVSAGLPPNLLLLLSKRNLGRQSPSKQHQGVSGSICCRLFQRLPVLHILCLLYVMLSHQLPHTIPFQDTFSIPGAALICAWVGAEGEHSGYHKAQRKAQKYMLCNHGKGSEVIAYIISYCALPSDSKCKASRNRVVSLSTCPTSGFCDHLK